jgi:radical SAM-linked protein
MPKYLFTFAKGESVRWLGHLDILRTFERAIRRAGLPIAFSNGFNPRERLAFASALSTGVTGGAERASLELTQPLPAEEIAERLNAVLPPGIRLQTCEEVPDVGSRDLLNAFDSAEYTVVCACPPETDLACVQNALVTLLAQPQLPVTREREGRTRTIDIRPYLFALTLDPESHETLANERLTLRMQIAQGDGGNAKPNEVVEQLAAYLPGLRTRRAHRVCLLIHTVNENDKGDRINKISQN